MERQTIDPAWVKSTLEKQKELLIKMVHLM